MSLCYLRTNALNCRHLCRLPPPPTIRFYVTLSGQTLTGREATHAAKEDEKAGRQGLGPAAKDRSTIMRSVRVAAARSGLFCDVLLFCAPFPPLTNRCGAAAVCSHACIPF